MPLRIALQFPSSASQDKGDPHIRRGALVFRILYIFFSLGFGVLLVSLPWQSFWENNSLLYHYPRIRPLIANAYFKGAVLGLGIADIIIGIYEIAHFKQATKGSPR
ncbi:MAG: hypothetical protein JXA73_03950 [Acidobacteria bacterium]|nr:hypothetical protein [Acidobacteriota bacterium]